MKNRRKTKFMSYLLCLAMLVGSLAPATVSYAAVPGEVSGYEAVAESIQEPLAEQLLEEQVEMPSEEPIAESPEEPSGEPDETETPEAVETPGETETPGAESTPVSTEVPAGESTPEAMETPEAIETPEVPAETPSADPDATIDPNATAEPEATADPEATIEPAETETPEATEEPESTEMPEETGEPADLDYILGRPMTEAERAAEQAAMPHTLRDLPEEIPVESYDSGIATFARIPASYDSRNEGFNVSVKNQNPYGSCWTYATIASMESTLIRKGLADASEVDLSEWHLAYFATHTGADKLGNTKDDYVKAEGGVQYMDNGGNIQMSAIALSNWKGATLESDYPGNPDRNALSMATRLMKPEDAWQKNRYYMKNCHMSPAEDRDNVKLLIMEYGAVYGSYYHDDYYYKEDTAAYNCDVKGSNHAITVIGWDDNYKKENFYLQPEGDGAWLCKNSWGTTFGDEGYFYISYYDVSFHRKGGNVAAYEAEVLTEGMNNYYYSGGVDFTNYMSVNGIAQVYESKANPGGSEMITGTGFMTYSANIEYSVQVYKNPKLVNGAVEDPLSGEPVWNAPETGVTGFAGYQTIDFEKPVQVDEGDLFAVVITFADTAEVVVDINFAMYSGYNCVYDSYNVTKEGESFAKIPVIEAYLSLYDEKEGITPRMNVFTKTEKTMRLFEENPAGGAAENLGEFSSVQGAVDAALANDPTGNYVIEFLKPTTVVGAVEIPETFGSLKLCGTEQTSGKLMVKAPKGTEIIASSNLILEDITLESADETFDISTKNGTLTMKDMVFFASPAKLTGNAARLFVEGDVSMELTTEYLQGEISGFDRVVIDELFVLNTYDANTNGAGGEFTEKQTGGTLQATELILNARLDVMGNLSVEECDMAKGTRLVVGHPDRPADAGITNLRAMEDTYLTITGKFTSAGSVSFYGTNTGTADAPVYLRAGLEAASVTMQDVTMMEAWIESAGPFTISGNVLSEGRGNVLVTRQKPQENNNIPKTHLEIVGEVTLAEPEDQITVYVKKEKPDDPNKEAAYFWLAAKTPLLVAAKASTKCFRASDENLAVNNNGCVLGKTGTSIFAYYAEKWEIEVIREKDGQETSVGCYRTFEAATAAVNALKDKKSNYTFLLNEHIGESDERVELVLPSYAAHVTVRGKEFVQAIYLKSQTITLKTDTTLDCLDLRTTSGKIDVAMGAYDLTLCDVRETNGFGKITHDTKKKVALRLEQGTERNQYQFTSVNVDDLYISDGIGVKFDGKLTVANLSLGADSWIDVTTKGNAITNLVSYVPYVENSSVKYSAIYISSNANLTIKNNFVSSESERLYVGSYDGAVTNLTKDNWFISAPNAALSSFYFDYWGREFKGCKHDGKIYYLSPFSANVILTYGESGGYESAFIDWYQAVAEINRLNRKNEHYLLKLSNSGDTVPRLLSAEYKKINAPSALVMPGKDKCASFTADGNPGGGIGRIIWAMKYKGNITAYGDVTLKNFYLAPIKIESKKTYWAPGNLVLKSNSSGVSRLTLDNVESTDNTNRTWSFETVNEGYGVVFNNITGEAGKSELYLENEIGINISGNVTGLKGFYIAKDSYQQGEIISPSIGGKVTVTELGIWSKDLPKTENIGISNGLLVLGQLTADRLVGANGLLWVRQTSSSNKNTLAQIKKTVTVPDGKPMMIGIIKPSCSTYTKLIKASSQGKNPFVESVRNLPLIKAPAASSECFRALEFRMGIGSLSIIIPSGMRYYKDTNGYIRAEDADAMSIRITAVPTEGESSVSYARNWYEAMKDITKMGNHYAEYKVELCESRVYMTGYNTKTKKETFGSFTMPTKAKGKITITSSQGVVATLVYSGEMKVPDGVNLAFEKVSVDCQNSSKASVAHKVTIGKNANLSLNNMTDSFGNMSKIAAGNGSLTLEDTALSVSGTTSIKNLYVVYDNNKLSGKGTITVQHVAPVEGSLGTVNVETTSVYTKNKNGTYTKTKLSGFSVTGGIEAGAEVRLTIKKDMAKEPEGASAFYGKADLRVADLDGLTALNRLAVVKGNASENRIRIRLENGSLLSHPADGHLITESNGLYLVQESPAVKVISKGGTTTDYLGYFRSFDKALAAVEASAKKDFAISSKNAKCYEVIFLQEPTGEVTGVLPKSAKEIVISHDLGARKMPLTIKGGISHGNASGTVTIQDMELKTTGNVTASALVLGNTNITAAGSISLKNLTMEDAFLLGNKVTVTKTTAMAESHISAAADKKASTGTLKLAKLIDTSVDEQGMNYLSAKANDKGATGLSISGEILALHERNEIGQRFAIWISKNKDNTVSMALMQGTKLCEAPKADAGLLRPAYSDIDSWGMAQWQIDRGLYKKGTALCYGDISKVKAVLVNETTTEDTAYPGETLRGSDTGFLSLKEAFAEINSRKNKKASYRVYVYEDAACKSSGKYTALTLPAYAKELALEGISGAYAESGEPEDLVTLSYLGKVSPKYPLTLQNIRLDAYKKSGKKQISGGPALAGGTNPVFVSGAVVMNGSANINKLSLSGEAALYVRDGLSAGEVSYEAGAKVLLDSSRPLTLTGTLKPASAGEKLSLQLRETSAKNGTKVVKTGFFMQKPDLDCLQVKDASGNSYKLYRDGRYVYVRK